MAWWKILLIVLAAALGILAWRFRDEIRAFVISRQYSPAELETQLADNDQTIRDAVDASSDVTVRPPTDEEREALRDGSLTQDDLIGRLTDSGEANAPAEPAETAESESDASDYQKQLSELIAADYVLREEYLGALGSDGGRCKGGIQCPDREPAHGHKACLHGEPATLPEPRSSKRNATAGWTASLRKWRS